MKRSYLTAVLSRVPQPSDSCPFTLFWDECKSRNGCSTGPNCYRVKNPLRRHPLNLQNPGLRG
jgi:hypothetical protein